jgi:hypothetical protein
MMKSPLSAMPAMPIAPGLLVANFVNMSSREDDGRLRARHCSAPAAATSVEAPYIRGAYTYLVQCRGDKSLMPSGLELSAQSAVCGAAKKGCSRRKYREFVPIWPSADRARVALEDDHHLRPLLARTDHDPLSSRAQPHRRPPTLNSRPCCDGVGSASVIVPAPQ